MTGQESCWVPPPKCGVQGQPGGSAPAAKTQLWYQAQESFLEMPFKDRHLGHWPYWGTGCLLGPGSASHGPTGSQEASLLQMRGESNVTVSETLPIRKDRGAAGPGPPRGGLCSVRPHSTSHQSCNGEMLTEATQTCGYTPLEPSPPRPGCQECPLKFHASSSPEAPRETVTGQKLYPG